MEKLIICERSKWCLDRMIINYDSKYICDHATPHIGIHISEGNCMEYPCKQSDTRPEDSIKGWFCKPVKEVMTDVEFNNYMSRIACLLE